MKRIVVVVIFGLLLFSKPVVAKKEWMVGTELDLVPFVFDGYYTSIIGGYKNYRGRFILTKITTPSFVTQTGFKDNKLRVNAYVVDYYFEEGFEGWWIGPGIEIWKGSVEEKSSGVVNNYKTTIFTLGGGYTFRFNDHLYLNPWVAVHVPVGGDRKVAFANDTFKIKPVPEGSLKIGFNF